MPTPPAPAPRDRAGLALDEGPIADALSAIDTALADIETAKGILATRRSQFGHTFRREVSALVEAGDDGALAEALRAAVSDLYWNHGTLRMTDLSAATGLSNERLRQVAGPRVIEVACRSCGAPTEVLQRSRSDRLEGFCTDCRRPTPEPRSPMDPWRPRAGSGLGAW